MTPTFVNLHVLAQLTGLPKTWLKGEAEAGRLPCIRAGRRFLFDFATVERALLELAGADRNPAEGRPS